MNNVKRRTCSFSLKPKLDAGGKVRIKSDNVAAGLGICLLGLLAAGFSIALSGENGAPAERHERDRKPFRAANSLYSKNIDEIDVTQFGFDAEPSEPTSPTTTNDPDRFDGKSLLTTHGLTAVWLLAALAGIRVMFTGTTILIDPRQARVHWRHTGFLGSSSRAYALSDASQVLHETVVRSRRTLDWHGFAASLVTIDHGAIQLARSKTMDGVKGYAEGFQKLTGLEATQIGTEEANAHGLYMWHPFSLKR